jgi:hypothetical protein
MTDTDTNRIAQLEADLARAVATIELLTDGVLVPCRREGCKGGFTMAHWWRAGPRPEREAQSSSHAHTKPTPRAEGPTPGMCSTGQCPHTTGVRRCTRERDHKGAHVF